MICRAAPLHPKIISWMHNVAYLLYYHAFLLNITILNVERADMNKSVCYFMNIHSIPSIGQSQSNFLEGSWAQCPPCTKIWIFEGCEISVQLVKIYWDIPASYSNWSSVNNQFFLTLHGDSTVRESDLWKAFREVIQSPSVITHPVPKGMIFTC